jgi:lysophospholipase L1-like esterase
MERQQFFRAYLIVFFAVGLLLGYPYLHRQLPVEWQKNLRTYDLGTMYFSTPDSTAVVDSSLVEVDTALLANAGVDSVQAPRAFPGLPLYDAQEQYSGYAFLGDFLEKLKKKEGQIRIAYYGDSSIEGDLLCQTFREELQARFGGQGVGFVGLTNPIPYFRQSVRLDFSKTWRRYTVVDKKIGTGLFGIAGEYFRPYYPAPDTSKTDSLKTTVPDTLPKGPLRYWVTMGASKSFSGTAAFSKARLFYGPSKKGGKVSATCNELRSEFSIPASENVGDLLLHEQGNSTFIRLDFKIPADQVIYGISLEGEKGVYVDNFSLRGNAGRNLNYIESQTLRQFQEKLQYDLIILQFGLNVLNANLKNYSFYTREMNAVLAHYQQALPGVPILIVGPSDKSMKIDGAMHTDPSVPRINNALRRAAAEHGASFFSMYEAMGGQDSMVKWVEQSKPRLANTDYTHFNFAGGRVASGYLVKWMLGE